MRIDKYNSEPVLFPVLTYRGVDILNNAKFMSPLDVFSQILAINYSK